MTLVTEWKRWFAWYPVRTVDARRAWLRSVEWRYVYVQDYLWHCDDQITQYRAVQHY
jgi:hypothetical protein